VAAPAVTLSLYLERAVTDIKSMLRLFKAIGLRLAYEQLLLDLF
jgi:hypothetical protein